MKVNTETKRILIGWSEINPVNLLASNNPESVTQQYRDKVANAENIKNARESYVNPDDAIFDPSSELTEYANSFWQQPGIEPFVQEGGWTIKIADLKKVCTIQPAVEIKKSKERVKDIDANNTLSIASVTIPIGVNQIFSGSFDQGRNAFIFSSANPNLRIASTISNNGIFGFGVQMMNSFVQVAKCQGRYYMRDGHHRAYGLLSRGISKVHQFSGAIKGMKWQVKGHGMGGSGQDMLMYGFAYDQKYQLLSADFGTVTAASEATFNSSTAFSLANTYDINGNLLSKLRKDNAGSSNHDFTYAYGSTPVNNTLNTLTGTGIVSKTFEYDQAGKTTRETSGGNTVRSMTYNPYDLLTEVKTYNATLGYDVTQEKSYYNERGQRIKKEVYTTAGVLSVTTWYVRDVAGSIISVYDNSSGTMIQTELPIYGMGKIGQALKTASTTSYTYELTDHLGTVRATINRVKSSGAAVIETWADYYADGEVMPGRSGTTSLATRYGYQGQFAEKNAATGFIDFDLRNYDITAGRWIQPDPYDQHWSPYNGMGNNPVSMVDPDGGWSMSSSLGYGGGGGGGCSNYNQYQSGSKWKPFKGKNRAKPNEPPPSSGSENNTGGAVEPGANGDSGDQNEPMDGTEDGGGGIKVTGSRKDKELFIDQINEATGNDFEIDDDDMLKLKSGTYNTETTKDKSGELSQLFKDAIEGKQKIPYKLVSGNKGKRVFFDSYTTKKYDVGDFDKGLKSNKAVTAGLMGHVLKERMSMPGYSKRKNRTDAAYNTAHDKFALVTEGSIVTRMLGLPNSSADHDFSDIHDSNGNPARLHIFDFGAKKFQIQSGSGKTGGVLLSGFD
jgi:RHS repeat-associated protein